MPKAPVELTLYDENDEKIKTLSRIIVPWGVLKKAVRMSKAVNKDGADVSEETLDELSDLVIQIFGARNVTREDLENYSDMVDMITVIQTIVARGQGLIPNAPPAAGR